MFRDTRRRPRRNETEGVFPASIRPGMPEPRHARVLYHGTSSWENAQRIKRNGFIPSEDGCLGRGVYVAREDKARRFAQNSSRHSGAGSGGLVEVIVTLSNPTRAGKPRATMRAAPIALMLRRTMSGASGTPPRCASFVSPASTTSIGRRSRAVCCASSSWQLARSMSRAPGAVSAQREQPHRARAHAPRVASSRPDLSFA